MYVGGIIKLVPIITARQRNGEGNVFSLCVCLSVHRGGVSVQDPAPSPRQVMFSVVSVCLSVHKGGGGPCTGHIQT